MESNWYVICTRSNKERKVMASFNRKGIEAFCPFTIIEKKHVSRTNKEYGPLFGSCIFVKMRPAELPMVNSIAYVVNPLYWKNQPAVINSDEINAIKMMCENYNTVRIERSAIKENEKISVTERNITGYNNHTITVQHQGISVTLPTLGYTLSAERDKKTVHNVTANKLVKRRSIVQRLNLLSFLGINL